MVELYEKLVKRKLEAFRDKVIIDLKSYKLSSSFVIPNEPARLITTLDQLKAKLMKLESVSINAPMINLRELIEDYYLLDIKDYKTKCEQIRTHEKSSISRLKKDKDDVVKINRKDLEELLQDNLKQVEPYSMKHDKLKSKRKELENLFKLYGLQCNGFEIDTEMSLNELDEIMDLAKYGAESVLRDKSIVNRICELLYLPLVVEIEDKMTKDIFSAIYLVSLLLLCFFCKPAVALVSVMYLINMVTNVTHVLQRKELLQMAYAVSEDIDFTKYVKETDDILEARKNLEESIAYDLSADILKISNESKVKIEALEDPSIELESNLNKATVAMSDGYIETQTDKVVQECQDNKQKLVNEYKEKISIIERIIEKLPKETLGDDIRNSDLLSTEMRLGSINVKGEPIVEVTTTIPYSSIGFIYKDEESRADVLRYMKLLMSNYICNINPKQLVVDIYDEVGLGSEVSEFITGTSLDYIRTVNNDFNKLFLDIKADIETNINKFSVSDIQKYNEEASRINKTTMKYRMLVILSGVKLEDNEPLKNFIRDKTKQGLLVFFLYKDSSMFKDDAKASLEFFYNKILTCRKYGEVKSPEGITYGKVEEPATAYNYTPDIGRKVMSTYNRLLEERKGPILKFKDDYLDIHLPKEKYWTGNTLNGIEAHFGFRDGDPTKPECHIFGDDTPHCLTVGRTGSGKSVFLNNAIADMIHRYSPEWLVLGMIDFKNTEFFIFQGEHAIPHAKFVAGTTDGEYAVSIFDYLDKEMARRNEHFLKFGTKNLKEYNSMIMRGGVKDIYDESLDRWFKAEIMPRMLFIVDEFQVMFNKVDSKSLRKIEQAIVSLSKVARSAGCHLWFASQSMTGTMSEDILNQFKLRVALGCDEKLSSNILGNPAASTIDRLGYSYSNDSGGSNPNANKYWRTPFIATDVFLNYLKEMNDKCTRENSLRRTYKVFNEKETFNNKLLEERLKMEGVHDNPDLFILGETMQFSVNEYPPNMSIFKDNSENIIFGTYDVGALVNGINTFIANIKSKDNTEIIIHSVDKDIALLLGAKEKITPKYELFLNNEVMDLENIFTVMEATLEARRTHPEIEYPRLFFIGIGWDKLEGLGEDMRPKVETRFKSLLDKCPKYGIHFIICDRDISNFKSLKKNFVHRIGSKLDNKSNTVVEPNEKLADKDLLPHVAIYSTDELEMKFKLYQFPTVGEVRVRGIKKENYN